MLQSEGLGAEPSILALAQIHVHAAMDRLDALLFRLLPLDNLEARVPTSPSLMLLISLTAVVAVQLAASLSRSYEERGVPISHPLPEQARPGWEGKVLSPPRIASTSQPNTITCYDPATGYHIADLPADTPETIRQKIQKAKAAQSGQGVRNSGASFSTRRRVLRTLQKWVVDQSETIVRVAARDTGKTAIDAAFGELLTTCSKIEWTLANGERVLAPETRPNNLLLAHKVCQVHHEPLGVVVACVSWNYSAHNVLGPIIAALFAGNAIIVKASELVAWSATFFIEGVRECLRAAGADPELVQLVVCFPDAAEALTTSADVSHITFIGSEDVGRKVAVAATRELTPVTLELGGKDPAILLKDADLKYFQSTFMRSCFQGAGQNCIGIERFIVDSSLVASLVALVQPRIEALRCGSWMDEVPFGSLSSASVTAAKGQVDCGAMITDARFDRLEWLLDDAVQRGAKVLVGGKRFRHPKWTEGHYFQPTLVVDVTPDMPIAQEELFAPIFLVLPFRSGDIDAAIKIANGTRYGLGSSVFGSTAGQCRYVAARLECGMVNINDFGVSYLNQHLPFGGVKKSGYGRFGGAEGLLSLTSPKAITSDRLFRYVRTGIPPPVDYPLANGARGWRFVNGLLRFAYGDGILERGRGLGGLIGAAL
ncbi:related to aldehyde dehydrogenase [Pseudozyma flocculosa]|uniref:Related to aldehyde dehydrogenase n=2 Tax=Pseudozyma flocculosa TaxID=84751 RepID=A0A5C3EX26_9BASI|nr:related to aldehyde dehydrogenase [Pseudozyma flocculosa]